MKIASWNVNSLKVRLPHLLDWLKAQKPDVLCLQELKLEDHNYPVVEIAAAGYQSAFSGQKTYNGVAILSRHPINDICIGNPLFADEQKRLITGTINGIRVICAYMPNGQAVGSDKFEYKLRWLDALKEWTKSELSTHEQLALCGDYNIAPDDRDVHDPKSWQDQILCSAPERAAFHSLINLGLDDSFRLFDQPDKLYSWWDYRMLGFQKNRGLRIDHILLSKSLTTRCTAAGIDRAPRKLERPSDHAPVWVDLAL